jgi:hypothetical protein
MQRKYMIGGALAGLGLAGATALAAGGPGLSCSSDTVTETVEQIIHDQGVGKAPTGLFAKMKFTSNLENIRTVGPASEPRTIQCKAVSAASFAYGDPAEQKAAEARGGSALAFGTLFEAQAKVHKYNGDISYSVETQDDGKLYVSVYGHQ